MKLRCSQAGFGCYRVSDGVLPHREALQMALEGNIAQALQTLGASEDAFGWEVLPNLEISGNLRGRIAARSE